MRRPLSETEHLLFVGTYTRETSAGIYGYRFNSSTGSADPLGLLAETRDPSFLARHPNGHYLYAVNEVDDFDSDGSGSISSFSIDAESFSLRKLNEVSSRGGWPCHLDIDDSGRMLIVANYKGGNVASFPINEDGTLGEAASFYQHVGSGIHSRQERPHAHSADFSPDNRFAFFSDLGIDQVRIYRTDPATATIEPGDPASVDLAPGSGPRHFALHPSGRFAFGINELSSTVTAYGFDSHSGSLTVQQTLSTVPESFAGENFTAEIHVHRSGGLVYGSNRGHDSLAVFGVAPESGRLDARGHVSTGGEWPRNFAFDPTGQYLLAANQNSDNITVFRIDVATGALEPTGTELAIDAPVCLLF